jgi:hypothetical protein
MEQRSTYNTIIYERFDIGHLSNIYCKGEEERNKCFLPIMEELAKYLPITDETRYKYRVVCPGSGLGRLPFEICKRGTIQRSTLFDFLFRKNRYASNFQYLFEAV